jgi:DNA-binding MarR family transcriptional regulator
MATSATTVSPDPAPLPAASRPASSARPGPARPALSELALISPELALVDALQAATRVLTGIALRSLDVLDGSVSLPQFRLLAVLAELGRARSGRVALALRLEPSTVTRLADKLVASGHVERGSEPGHRSVVTLELTPRGRDLVTRVHDRRRAELAQIAARLDVAGRAATADALRLVVAAAGDGYGRGEGPLHHGPVPV